MEHEPPHILLIEDNPGDADLVRLRLVESKSEVHVNCVPRLSDALACLDAETPSLVLLDLNLPDSHGAETFRRIRQKAPNVPVVILSGQDDEALAIKAVHQGVQDYLVKGDITSKQLERALRYAIERQGLLRSLEITRQQQLEFKNRFLSHVSHELRTPLTCILRHDGWDMRFRLCLCGFPRFCVFEQIPCQHGVSKFWTGRTVEPGSEFTVDTALTAMLRIVFVRIRGSPSRTAPLKGWQLKRQLETAVTRRL
jgi:DNA-binding NarL/FixJ family response regulator